jgi:phage protein D
MPEQPDLNTLLRTAHPTINLDGRDNSTLAQGLLSLSIIEQTSGLYRCEATFGNWGPRNGAIDFLYFDRQTIDFGKTLKIKIENDVLFEGRITALEAHFAEAREPEIAVLAEDRFQDLRMTRRTRTFDDVSDSDVFNCIAGDHGLSPSVSVTGPNYRVLAQINQSDLAFLRERARAIDAELWMEGSTLNVKSHANRGGNPIELGYGRNLHAFNVLADLAQQRTSVAVNGWDVAGKSGLQYEAAESAVSSELNGDTSGVSILQSAFGARKEALAHAVPLNSGEAQALAEAYFKLSARRFVVGRGSADTDPKLRVGAQVNIQNVGPLFSGKYYLTEVRHLFDLAQGLRTEFTAERPGIGRAT